MAERLRLSGSRWVKAAAAVLGIPVAMTAPSYAPHAQVREIETPTPLDIAANTTREAKADAAMERSRIKDEENLRYIGLIDPQSDVAAAEKRADAAVARSEAKTNKALQELEEAVSDFPK